MPAGKRENMSSEKLGGDRKDLFPVLTPGGSDSACFDNALALLVRSGRSLPHAMMMMVPEAFGPNYHISTVIRRLRMFGFTREELSMILAPMVLNAQEPVGSMGTDTTLAVLSNRPKLLFNYFKQLFAQVKNPPIDPLREGLVMSLMSFIGKQRNLLSETPRHCRQLKMPHPILTNEDIIRLREAGRKESGKTTHKDDFQITTIYALFEANQDSPGENLQRGLHKLLDDAEQATPWPLWPRILRTSSSHQEGCQRRWSVLTKKFSGIEMRVNELHRVEVEWRQDEKGMFPGYCPIARKIPGLYNYSIDEGKEPNTIYPFLTTR